jgi:hypothetical protein
MDGATPEAERLPTCDTTARPLTGATPAAEREPALGTMIVPTTRSGAIPVNLTQDLLTEIRSRYASVNTPVADGRIVSVFGDEMLNAAVERVQKHSTFPAPAPVEFRITAYLILFSADPDAVNTNPAVV